jgi:hypothetical protein
MAVWGDHEAEQTAISGCWLILVSIPLIVVMSQTSTKIGEPYTIATKLEEDGNYHISMADFNTDTTDILCDFQAVFGTVIVLLLVRFYVRLQQNDQAKAAIESWKKSRLARMTSTDWKVASFGFIFGLFVISSLCIAIKYSTLSHFATSSSGAVDAYSDFFFSPNLQLAEFCGKPIFGSQVRFKHGTYKSKVGNLVFLNGKGLLQKQDALKDNEIFEVLLKGTNETVTVYGGALELQGINFLSFQLCMSTVIVLIITSLIIPEVTKAKFMNPSAELERFKPSTAIVQPVVGLKNAIAPKEQLARAKVFLRNVSVPTLCQGFSPQWKEYLNSKISAHNLSTSMHYGRRRKHTRASFTALKPNGSSSQQCGRPQT